MPTALITGTSTGIGEACAALLAARGWTVYAGVRRERDGERLRATYTGDLRPVILDVTNREHIARVVDELAMTVGDAGLQGLVNNAGVGVGGPSEYLEDDAWRTVFEANFFGVIALTREAMPLLKRGPGRVVHIGSIGGRIATPGLAPYAASKHALEALAEASRLEFALAGSPVRVSLIEPGAIATAIWDKADASVDVLAERFERGEGPEYEWLLDEARGFVVEGRRNGIPPSRVAEVVEHALTAPRPKARYLVGADAKLAGHVIARLPDRAREALLILESRRLQGIGAAFRRDRANATNGSSVTP
jgi:NAD(P)-dependent dehydrogenase (short-subunit alcohol dehydrogenase family)